METPDQRPGVVLMVAAPTKKILEKELARRLVQAIVSTPTASAFDYMIEDPEIELVKVGDSISLFADGHQTKGNLGKREVWQLPSFEGDFFFCDIILL